MNKGPVHMGRQILKAIFEVEELCKATPSGRVMRGQNPEHAKQLDEDRQWQILGMGFLSSFSKFKLYALF